MKYDPLRLAKKHDKMMKLVRRASKSHDALVDYLPAPRSIWTKRRDSPAFLGWAARFGVGGL